MCLPASQLLTAEPTMSILESQVLESQVLESQGLESQGLESLLTLTWS